MKLSNKYHKIMSIYMREGAKKKGRFIIGEWSTPEIKYLKDNDWVWTEKVDGMNIRVIWENGELSFAGRSDDATLPKELEKYLRLTFTHELMNRYFPKKTVCLYGEGYGNAIGEMGLKYIADTNRFVLLDVNVEGLFLERHNIEDIAKKLGIDVVPVVGHGTIPEAIEYVKKGFKSNWGNFIAEGLVLRPRVELITREGERIITKIKHKDFEKTSTRA